MQLEQEPHSLSATVTFENVHEMHAVYGNAPISQWQPWYDLLSRIPGLTNNNAYPKTVKVPHTVLGHALGRLATSTPGEASDSSQFREFKNKQAEVADQLANFFSDLRQSNSTA
jgi:hypothetical protein